MDHANFFEILVRISEYNSKWISISRILHENTKANPTEKYSSSLKLKNHVKYICTLYIAHTYQWIMKWVVVDIKKLGKYMPSMNDRSIFEIPAFSFCQSGKKPLSLFTLFLYHIWYSGYDINLYVTTNILDIPY